MGLPLPSHRIIGLSLPLLLQHNLPNQPQMQKTFADVVFSLFPLQHGDYHTCLIGDQRV